MLHEKVPGPPTHRTSQQSLSSIGFHIEVHTRPALRLRFGRCERLESFFNMSVRFGVDDRSDEEILDVLNIARSRTVPERPRDIREGADMG
jgi:hypothetical protein